MFSVLPPKEELIVHHTQLCHAAGGVKAPIFLKSKVLPLFIYIYKKLKTQSIVTTRILSRYTQTTWVSTEKETTISSEQELITLESIKQLYKQ